MESNDVSTPQLLTEKEVRSKIEQQLEQALIDWKHVLGEKKYKKRIKKAGKILAKKIKLLTAKSATKKEKAAKKKKEKAAV